MKKISFFNMYDSIIVGASGLVGENILENLKGEKVLLILRTELKNLPNSVDQKIINFKKLHDIKLPKANKIFICHGTRLGLIELLYIKKKDRKSFIEVDYEYSYILAKKAFHAGCKKIAFISAVGSNPKSLNLYLKTKGTTENTIKQIGFKSIVFARPGHLLGIRKNQKNKLLISLFELFTNIVGLIMIRGLSKYKNIDAKIVAFSVVKEMKYAKNCINILEYNNMVDIWRKK